MRVGYNERLHSFITYKSTASRLMPQILASMTGLPELKRLRETLTEIMNGLQVFISGFPLVDDKGC